MQVYGGDAADSVIHAIGLDFREVRKRKLTTEDAAQELRLTYAAIFQVVAASGPGELRLLPMSSGIFDGRFKEYMPALTAEALRACIEEMDMGRRRWLCGCDMEMCISHEVSPRGCVKAVRARWGRDADEHE